jgi:hypothetical protein
MDQGYRIQKYERGGANSKVKSGDFGALVERVDLSFINSVTGSWFYSKYPT